MPRFKCSACRKVNDRQPAELKNYWGKNLQLPCLHCNQPTGYIVHRFNGYLVDTTLADGYTEEERLWWWEHFGGRIGESCILYTIGKYTKWFVKKQIETHGPGWWLWKSSLIAARRMARQRPEPISGEQILMF